MEIYMNVYTNITQLIGKTPLFEPTNYEAAEGIKAKLLCKLEYLNPAGSIKDRAALNMIEAAERSGELTEGSVIIEPTSGNTGIGIAAIAAYKGYKVILTMPETMSVERRKLLSAYGAEIVLTKGSEGMKGAIEKANELAAENKRVCAITAAMVSGTSEHLTEMAISSKSNLFSRRT